MLPSRSSGEGGNRNGIYLEGTGSPVLRNVSVDSSGGTGTNIGIFANGGSEIGITMEHVSVNVSGGTSIYGLWLQTYPNPVPVVIRDSLVTVSGGIAVYSNNTNVVLSNVVVSAPGGVGFYNYAANLTMINVTASADTVLMNNCGSSCIVDRCTLDGTSAIWNSDLGTMKIGGSKLIGLRPDGIFTCVASYDENYSPLSSTCQ